jgi:hypothetical protein
LVGRPLACFICLELRTIVESSSDIRGLDVVSGIEAMRIGYSGSDVGSPTMRRVPPGR